MKKFKGLFIPELHEPETQDEWCYRISHNTNNCPDMCCSKCIYGAEHLDVFDEWNKGGKCDA
jgi:hypothetical protein